MEQITISEAEFVQVRAFALREAGISLSPTKQSLVMGRWNKRLLHHGLGSYGAYLKLINDQAQSEERRISIDLLTTNETYFFREPKHFDFLRDSILPGVSARERFRVWSAACSTGEEPYSIAMLLSDRLAHHNWDLLGTDLSTRVLESARQGLYDTARTRDIPADYLRRFCLKGTGPYTDKVLIDEPLRERVQFSHVNLNETLPRLGLFDVVFLRNVMIYFEPPTKVAVVARIANCLRPGGYLIIGHSDTLNGVAHALQPVKTSIFRKPVA
jgi:chemotaxis protein methyltransferase CheR